jgi:hypothetical protein
MKRHFKRRSLLLAIALCGACSLASVTGFAGTGNGQQTITAADGKAFIQYIGSDKTGTTFRIGLEQETAVKFALTVSATNGDVFYNQEFETANFSKTIKLQEEITGKAAELIFSISILPNGGRYQFDVNSMLKKQPLATSEN